MCIQLTSRLAGPRRDRLKGNRRAGRINEREDPEDQVAGLRLPQSSTLPRCDHVPPWNARLVPTNRINPHGFLKRLFVWRVRTDWGQVHPHRFGIDYASENPSRIAKRINSERVVTRSFFKMRSW